MARPQHRATRVGSRRVVADVAVQLGGQVVNVALGIVTTVVIVRALEPTRYGEWATILAAIELIAMVGNLGLETVAVRLAAQEPEREGAWVGAATSLRLADRAADAGRLRRRPRADRQRPARCSSPGWSSRCSS